MNEQERDGRGKFLNKSDDHRQVRSVRVTDKTWNKLGEMAESLSITRADLIEQWVENEFGSRINEGQIKVIVEEILKDSEVTRKGKDKSAIRRGFEALLNQLFKSE